MWGINPSGWILTVPNLRKHRWWPAFGMVLCRAYLGVIEAVTEIILN